MSDWLVAVPSYKRVRRLAESTLPTLARGGVPAEKVTVFVADETEAEEYRQGLPKDLYKEIVVTEKGIARSRSQIAKHYPQNQQVVSVDDDVRGMLKLDSAGNKLVPMEDLAGFFGMAFALCRRHGARLWGLYPVSNAFFMRHGFTTDLRPVIGVVHGYVTDHSMPDLTCESKEDLERTLLYYRRDGAVVRFNEISAKQRSWDEPGGLQTPGGRTVELSAEVSKRLCQMFPGLCFPAPELHGHAQVKLKDTLGLGSNRKKLMKAMQRKENPHV